MATKKVTLKEFKEIVKNIIKEEKELTVKQRRVVNDLKKMKYSHKEAEELAAKHPDMNAVAINKKIKDEKMKGGK